MKRLWLFLVGILMLASCSDDVPNNPDPEVPDEIPTNPDTIAPIAGRTMLAYLVSNNGGGNLDNFLKYNLVDLYKGLSEGGKKATLLVFYRPRLSDKSLNGPTILKYVADGKGKVNGKRPIPSSELAIDGSFHNVQQVADLVIKQADLTESDSINEIATDPKVITRVLKKMTEMAPSTSYGLSMGSHGTGWLKAPRTTARSFGDDDGFSINIPELADALKTAFGANKLDFVLFDACMMANAEVAYELRDVTDYVIASVMETPVHGFPYARFIDEIYNEDIDYQEICDQFIEFNRQMNTWGTCAVVDCKQIQKLADWVRDHLQANADGLTEELTNEAFQYGRGPFYKYSFDVVDVFRQLERQEPVELLQIMDSVVVAKNCLEGDQYEFEGVVIDKDRFCGIGMYLPYLVKNNGWNTYYMEALAWPKAIEWNYKR